MGESSLSSSQHRIPLKVLVVDDSRIFRTAVARAFGNIDGCEVVGSVFSGEKALEYLDSNEVDLVTLDVEMPGMNGLQVLGEIQRKMGARAPRVLMLSAHTRSGAQVTVEALSSGAFSFVAKPEAGNPQLAMAELETALRDQVAAVRGGMVQHATRPEMSPPKRIGTGELPQASDTSGLVLIGASTGGPQALSQLLPALGGVCACPIVVVQHMPPLFTRSLADSLGRRCRQTVVEASPGLKVEPNHVYIARGGEHLELHDGTGGLCCRLTSADPENGCRPSVDVLFRSAARLRHRPMVAAILTGMGGDGSSALPDLKRAEATVLAQSEESCVVYGMPRMAVATGCVDQVADIGGMAEAIAESLVSRPR